ncbi:hypothetical protein GCM10022224_042030 [Nonomuraea antimicrobica]|uniref:Tyr recombinase domain-containing protein n=1 Tax=Nonomuraea antimicrobica TaxID=561173 RepID=A0ABP7BY80_9ACTN
MLKAAKSSELPVYVALSLTTGVRAEEARALRWDHVVAWIPSPKAWQPVTEAGFKHKRFAIYVWRADREGGDTKTRKSRRTLELPKLAAQALWQHHVNQAAHKLKAGETWQDHNLVLCTSVGTQLDASNVRRAFRKITKDAKIGTTWSPRGPRHPFVSIMSDQGVPIETIADHVGHAGTSVTEAVYPASTQASDHQRCPHDEHHLRRQPTRVENPTEMAPRLAPIDFQTREKGSRITPRTLLTCIFLVEMRGFEPLTPSMRTKCATGLRYIPKDSTRLANFGGSSRHRFSRPLPAWAARRTGRTGRPGGVS